MALGRHVTALDEDDFELRPILPGDREALERGFERVGRESRYRRFFAPVERLSEFQLDYLTEVDHHDHEALVALRDGEVIGVARFVRAEPGATAAEVAVTVVDDWQGQGLGTLLLSRLSRRAREEGIEKFTATVLADNRAVIELLEGLGETTVVTAGSGQLDLEIELEGDALRLLLRSAASGVAKFLSGRLTTP